ncbi:SEL1-like repeat protein [uncultured Muribaculum sp.]|uniref:SEL1-like repeat protein n=1 Tax=uncultured Muribaculum sp. TaxID=1918613 RepID=UPI00258707AC|nr:SEL1-like repeat protein [uncultured Muribaculum sp.]
MKAKLIIYILLTCIFTVSAQELKVTGFRAVPMDLSASTHMRRDANGTPCALVKVVLRAEGASFEGNVVGDTQFRTNEYWVYLTEGTKMLRIKHISAKPLMVKFSDYNVNGLQTKCTYEMDIELPATIIPQENTLPENAPDIKKKAIDAYDNKYYLQALDLFNSISNDAEAQYYLGKIYYNGYGVTKSPAIAFEWFQKSAQQGFVRSQNNLGVCYNSGFGTEISHKEAVYWFRKAAEQGLDISQKNLADMYVTGKGIEKSPTEAEYWYRKSAEQGLVYSQVNLGLMYLNGDGIKKDLTEALFWIRKAADKGYSYGQYHLARMYRFGWGVDESYPTAVEWLKKGAEQNNIYCILEIGDCYRCILDGWEGDKEEAKKWYEKAIDLGYYRGYSRLGEMYYYLNRTKENTEKALHYFSKGAEMNDSQSIYYIGLMYYQGSPALKKDVKKAFEWYKKSADLNNSYGQYNLGLLYYKGEGVKKDKQEAYRLIKQASDNGNIFADTFLKENTFNN